MRDLAELLETAAHRRVTPLVFKTGHNATECATAAPRPQLSGWGAHLPTLAPQMRGPMSRWRGWLALAIIMVMCAAMTQTGQGRRLLEETGVISRPTPYTGLAFAQPQSLPVQAASHAKFRVPFVIHNASAVTSDYRWSVSLVDKGRKAQLGSGTTAVAAGRTVTVTSTVDMRCSGGQARIEIKLARPPESIDFMLTCLRNTRTLP